jgi:hexosaminidase
MAARQLTVAALVVAAAGCGRGVVAGGDDLQGRDLGGAISDGGAADMTPIVLSPCAPAKTTLASLVPMPLSVKAGEGAWCLSPTAAIAVEPGTPELLAVGQYLAERLRPATGYPWAVTATQGPPPPGSLYLTTVAGDATLGDEGYALTITSDGVTLRAVAAAGLFHGIQTLRQLLPPAIESGAAQPGPWPLPAAIIRDRPRFGWRGVMLDVARHFFSVADVERLVDLAAYYKLNRLHLHLTDDQGWRIAVDSWPSLTSVGGSSEVGGATGPFFYTAADYSELVAYAAGRYIVLVPEIDMPGHSNAALASYAELNCNGVAPPIYTGTALSLSSLCMGKAITHSFVHDVVAAIGKLTPGPWLHLGGDEAVATAPSDYVAFVADAQAAVAAAGKAMIGWADIARASLPATAMAQHWDPSNPGAAQQAVQQHLKLIMSPASHAYLDMKYDASTPLGQSWAGYVDERQAYAWDPVTEVGGVAESDIAGVESPLWTETLVTRADLDYMAFPRLAGHAEIGWSPAGGRSWDEYKTRIATHGPRLTALGVSFYRSSRIPWP